MLVAAWLGYRDIGHVRGRANFSPRQIYVRLVFGVFERACIRVFVQVYGHDSEWRFLWIFAVVSAGVAGCMCLFSIMVRLHDCLLRVTGYAV